MKNETLSYLSLGSNINDKSLHLNKAIKYLSIDVNILNVSSIYKTDPLYYTKQSSFLNMVVEISTKYNFNDLLKLCKNIEIKIGRKLNKHRNRERIIDIDILTFNDSIYSDDNITIPHPKIHERKFVLIPWAEISPKYFLVNYRKNVTSLLNNTKDNSKVVKL